MLDKKNIDPELKKAICNDELVLFIGAGLSYNLCNCNKEQIGGWGNMVKQMLLHYKKSGYAVDDLLPLVSKYEPIKILDLIECNKELPGKEIGNFTKNHFNLDKSCDLSLHQKLFRLSRKIITTNYDTAFENAVDDLRLNKAYKGKTYELTRHKDPEASLLFKLHGCIEDFRSMVLYPSHYSELYDSVKADAEHALLVLKSLIFGKTILFIGTGMGDFQINHLFREIKKLQGDYNQKHFIITNKSLDSSLNFLTPIMIKNHSEIGEIIDILIEIKSECPKNESEEIKRLKEEKLEAETTIKKLEGEVKVLNERKSEFESKEEELIRLQALVDREAQKYFLKGLNYTIASQHKEAIAEYNTCVELGGKNHLVLNNIGYSYLSIAKLGAATREKEVEELYQKAIHYFKQGIELGNTQPMLYYNLGTAFSGLAKYKNNSDSPKLYFKAIDNYSKTVDLQPHKHEAFYNWGNALAAIANLKHGEEASNLYQQAIEKYQKATDLTNDLHEAFYNWGLSLSNIARIKANEESVEIYFQAIEKFKKTAHLKPEKASTYYSWGNALLEISKLKKGDEATRFFAEARSKYIDADRLGGKCYNLACSYAVTGEKELALTYLRKSLIQKDVEPSLVRNDEDWMSLTREQDFINLLKEFEK